ncbi:uncharacterized protein UDID_12078 [Ustilago sp. UG-2017a]|nr:uncharacterized protein UDID_12078 [Ustilago sp. UG-2017a]
MVSRRTRIVALLLLLAIHAVGVVSAWGFRSPDRGEWPEGQVLTDKGYVDITQQNEEHHPMLANAGERYREYLKKHNPAITSMKNGGKLHENEYGEALKIANRDGSTHMGVYGKDEYIASIIDPSSKLGKRLGLRPWGRIPYFSPKRYASVLWKHTEGGELSIVGVTKFRTKEIIPWSEKGLQELLQHIPK